MMLLWILGFLIAIGECSARCKEDLEEPWSYSYRNGPLFWPQSFPGCAGSQQSPINIPTRLARQNSNLQHLSFNNYDKPIRNGRVENNGHTVMITPEDGVIRSIYVSNVKFRLVQLHFHFGFGPDMGSEHSVNGQKYIMEGHLVHADSRGRLAVVGFFFEKTKSDGTAFQPIAQVLRNVRFRGQSTKLQSQLDLSAMLPCDPCPIYRYNGSLTTPMCNEGVIWSIIYPGVAQISKNELALLQGTYTASRNNKDYKSCPMYGNYRNIQKLNNRVITKSSRMQ